MPSALAIRQQRLRRAPPRLVTTTATSTVQHSNTLWARATVLALTAPSASRCRRGTDAPARPDGRKPQYYTGRVVEVQRGSYDKLALDQRFRPGAVPLQKIACTRYLQEPT